jgi:hypothetical protein
MSPPTKPGRFSMRLRAGTLKCEQLAVRRACIESGDDLQLLVMSQI